MPSRELRKETWSAMCGDRTNKRTMMMSAQSKEGNPLKSLFFDKAILYRQFILLRSGARLNVALFSWLLEVPDQAKKKPTRRSHDTRTCCCCPPPSRVFAYMILKRTAVAVAGRCHQTNDNYQHCWLPPGHRHRHDHFSIICADVCHSSLIL